MEGEYWPRKQCTMVSTGGGSPAVRGNVGGMTTWPRRWSPVVERSVAPGPARSCVAIQTTHSGTAKEGLYEEGGNTPRLPSRTLLSERFKIQNGGSLSSLALEHEDTRRLLSAYVAKKTTEAEATALSKEVLSKEDFNIIDAWSGRQLDPAAGEQGGGEGAKGELNNIPP
ncbi:hypothetical protein MRX96_053667 [Rhipicephalus microplus]